MDELTANEIHVLYTLLHERHKDAEKSGEHQSSAFRLRLLDKLAAMKAAASRFATEEGIAIADGEESPAARPAHPVDPAMDDNRFATFAPTKTQQGDR
jgi:hypothetical protein